MSTSTIFSATSPIRNAHPIPYREGQTLFLMTAWDYQQPEMSYSYWHEDPSPDSPHNTHMNEADSRAYALQHPDSEFAHRVRQADHAWLGEWTQEE